MTHLTFAVRRMRRNQVIDPPHNIIIYQFLFPHLLNKTGTKRQAKPKQDNIPPASIKLPPELLAKLANQLTK